MKIYIATGLKNFERQRELAKQLVKEGHEITYDWTVHGSVNDEPESVKAEVSTNEVQGVLDADAVVVLLPGGRGTNFEFGQAIGLGKPVILVGTKEQQLLNGITCAFYHLPTVIKIEKEFDAALFEILGEVNDIAD